MVITKLLQYRLEFFTQFQITKKTSVTLCDILPAIMPRK